MRYIEPHGHMVSRTTDDYQAMVAAGCMAVCEPAFWAGFDRGSVDGFRDYYRQLTEYEPARAAKFLLPHFCWLCLNPKESEDLALARDVLALIPEFLSRPNVLGIGEIGLNRNTRNELTVLEQHIELAVRHDQLILVHTPHLEDKLKGTNLILDVLGGIGESNRSASSSITSKSTRFSACSTGVSGRASRCIPIPSLRRRARSTCSKFAGGNGFG